jgi:hypothetical protein
MPKLGNMVITKASELGAGDMGPSPGPIYLPKIHSFIPTEPRVMIGLGVRFPVPRGGVSGPAPGSYNLPPAPHGPEYTIRGRTTFGSEFFNTASGNPGPGTHVRLETTQTRRKNAPAYSVRGRPQPGSLQEPMPAPGHTQKVKACNVPVFDASKPNIPGIIFGHAGRPDLIKPTSGDIGPGEYDITNTRMIAGYPNPPKFTMTFKHPPPKRATADAQFRNLPRGLGKQVVSASKTAPAFSMGARTKFCGYAKSADNF